MYDIAIIGGGASGLTAGIFAKMQSPDLQVVILERFDRVGKKIAVTGNGRCNITNENLTSDRYHGDSKLAEAVFADFGYSEQKKFFEALGLAITLEDGGKAYPLSLQASSVVDALRFKVFELGAEIRTGSRVENVKKEGNTFKITLENEKLTARNVIVAVGGVAGGNLGSQDGYSILKSFGHKITEIHPAIVQLKTKTPYLKAVKGIKLPAKLSAKCGNMKYTAEVGDLLFTEYGISGPAVLSLSSHYVKGDDFKIFADLIPEISQDKTLEMLKAKVKNYPERRAEELLSGYIHKILGREIVKYSGVNPNTLLCELSDSQLKMINNNIHSLEFAVTDTNGMKNAQVTSGGADTRDFDYTTLMSKQCDGLFASGEVLNVDGDCGGFNLAFAWASGRKVGISVAKRCEK